MAPPFNPWNPQIPPDIQAMLNRGNYNQALKEGATKFGGQLAKQGPRIVQAAAKVSGNILSGVGLGAEAEGVILAGEAVTLSPTAATLATAQRLAGGWRAVMLVAPQAAPLLMVTIGLAVAYLAFQKLTANAPPPQLTKEYQNLNEEIKAVRARKSLQDYLPMPGNMG